MENKGKKFNLDDAVKLVEDVFGVENASKIAEEIVRKNKKVAEEMLEEYNEYNTANKDEDEPHEL